MNKRLDEPHKQNADTGVPYLKWVLAAWLLGSLLFAHGCHGPDEDHELFTSIVQLSSFSVRAASCER